MFTIKKKRRLVIIVLIIFLIVLFGLITYKYIQARNEKYAGDEALTTAELDLKMITEYYPTKVYVYGDKITFHSSVDVENISKISNFVFGDKYKYELIIVNDLQGQTDLSKKEWSMLKEKIYNDNRINFFYLGDRQMVKEKEFREVIITENRKKKKINAGEIIHIKRKASQSIIYTKTNTYKVYETMCSIFKRLGEGFIRVNQGEIVNVKEILGMSGNTVVLKNGMEIQIGRTYCKEIRKKYWG